MTESITEAPSSITAPAPTTEASTSAPLASSELTRYRGTWINPRPMLAHATLVSGLVTVTVAGNFTWRALPPAPKTSGTSGVVFSSSVFATATEPTLQPARV